MKRLVIAVVLALVCSVCAFSQTTYFDSDYVRTPDYGARLYSVTIQPDGVVVAVEYQAFKNLSRLRIFSTSNTYIMSGDTKILQLTGVLANGKPESCGSLTNWGWDNVEAGATKIAKFFFAGTMPAGVTNFSMVDEGDNNGAHGFCFRNYTIENPEANIPEND